MLGKQVVICLIKQRNAVPEEWCFIDSNLIFKVGGSNNYHTTTDILPYLRTLMRLYSHAKTVR